MHVKIEKAAPWVGLSMLFIFMPSFVFLARFMPPLSPSMTAAEVADFYTEHSLGIRIGMSITLASAFLFAPLLASICRQVRRIEGYWGVLSICQIMLSVVFPFAYEICGIFAVTAAYRPERAPEITQALNDLFWFIFVGLVGPLVMQAIILAICVFIDKRERPSFPRWFAYWNLMYVLMGSMGGAIFLFYSGPLAWDGVFAFWVALTGNCIWFVGLAIMLNRAVDIEAAERAERAANREWEPAA
ncbi:hypothetical protein ACQPXT_34375 [Streptomyces sp. CA-100214]